MGETGERLGLCRVGEFPALATGSRNCLGMGVGKWLGVSKRR